MAGAAAKLPQLCCLRCWCCCLLLLQGLHAALLLRCSAPRAEGGPYEYRKPSGLSTAPSSTSTHIDVA
eukprot:COSAG01_NODE_37_length_34085_cov_64.376626_26_plen_68_part_00